jgi:membrane protease YdiL (CAAX protease family)
MIPRLQHLGLEPKWALLVSTVMFGLGHAYQGFSGLVAATITGAILGGVFLRTRRFWPVAIAHTLLDFMMVI